MTPNFSYIRVNSVKDAVKQLSDKGSMVMAGGTDLLGCLRDEHLWRRQSGQYQ